MVKQTAEMVASTVASLPGHVDRAVADLGRQVDACRKPGGGVRRNAQAAWHPPAPTWSRPSRGPVPATTCPDTAASVPAATAGLALGTTTLRLTVAIWLATSPFHHEKCAMVARSALPVGEAALATTVPVPSCVHRPVPVFSDQRAIVSPIATALPSWCTPA